MKIQTLLTLGALGSLVVCGCSKTGVNCDDSQQTVQWDLDTIAVAQRVAVNGIWGVNQSDVYAVGMVDTGQGAMGTVWHFDGSDWTVIHTRANAELQDVHIVSSSSVWIAGIGNPDNYPSHALVLHWNGTSWEESYNDPSTPGLLAVWAGADDDVYATGREGTVLHFDGASWGQEDIVVNGVPESWIGDVRDVWSIGNEAEQIVYLGCGSWRGIVLTRQGDNPWQLAFVMPYKGYDGHCVGVWARNPNDVYALEWTGRAVLSIGRVYHYADTAWNLTNLESGVGIFRSIRGSADGNVFALGQHIWRIVHLDSLEVYDGFPGYGTFALNDIWPDGHTLLIAGSSASLATFGVVLGAVFPADCP